MILWHLRDESSFPPSFNNNHPSRHSPSGYAVPVIFSPFQLKSLLNNVYILNKEVDKVMKDESLENYFTSQNRIGIKATVRRRFQFFDIFLTG